MYPQAGDITYFPNVTDLRGLRFHKHFRNTLELGLGNFVFQSDDVINGLARCVRVFGYKQQRPSVAKSRKKDSLEAYGGSEN